VKTSFLLIEIIIVLYVIANKKKGTSGLSLLIEMTDVTDLHGFIETLEGRACAPLLQIEVLWCENTCFGLRPSDWVFV